MSRLLKDWIALIPDWIETKCNILIREITFEPKKRRENDLLNFQNNFCFR